MDRVLEALEHLPCADCTHDEWVRVGMALKADGRDVAVWDAWSRSDAARYHPGECQRRWASFRGSGAPVTAGTIVHMARARGWRDDGCLGWDDAIGDAEPPSSSLRGSAPLARGRDAAGCLEGEDAIGGAEPPSPPAAQLIRYLRALFKEDEIVGYVTCDAWKAPDGRWAPGRGICDRTAGELIRALEKHPDDLGAAVGDWKEEAGAWIRFNPLDGKGAKAENVTAFRHALVESDSMDPGEQLRLLRKLDLPLAAVVFSGKKSMHAIVRVDAPDLSEYRRRVNLLYERLERAGLKVDGQNRDPGRLSRMPGATRAGVVQRLIQTRSGPDTWEEWLCAAQAPSDGLPRLRPLSELAADPPALPEELIQGVLRRGHKMLISGSSKAGKSFLLMELCACLAEGQPWLGFPCRKGRVLYVNLEIDPASCVERFRRIYQALEVPAAHPEDILLWNLRGCAEPLDQLTERLIGRVQGQRLDAIVIDPIYKVITGDENNASDMARFCNMFDRICARTGCAVIYSHHHAKGQLGAKRAMDRASGSGVFARDPDAQLDVIELALTDEAREGAAPGATAWRMESSLREFRSFAPVDFWFEYPLHRLDDTGALAEMPAQGSSEAASLRMKHVRSDRCNDEFRRAFENTAVGGSCTVEDLMDALELSDKAVYARLKSLDGEFVLRKRRIYRA